MALDELDVRRAAMSYLAEVMERSGGVVTRTQLEAFTYEGEQLKLIDQSRGIRNPRQLTARLSILSQPKGPYDDVETEGGLLRYAYRDGDPDGGDNRKLRRAAELGLPLVLLQGIAAGVFVATFPVYVVADDPVGRYVEIAVDESLRYLASPGARSDPGVRRAPDQAAPAPAGLPCSGDPGLRTSVRHLPLASHRPARRRAHPV